MVAVAIAAAAHGAPEPGRVLTPGDIAGDWKALIGALSTKGPIEASFIERRYFPFRREPMVLSGVLRISPERGLSLQYTGPDPSVLVADPTGLILRDARGRSREMPSGSREAGAIASLLPIMRFDMPALLPRFVIRAQRTDADWKFEFTPRDPDAAGSLGTITVTGAGTDVRRLEFRRSASQRVEIEVGATRTGVVFTAAEQARYFR